MFHFCFPFASIPGLAWFLNPNLAIYKHYLIRWFEWKSFTCKIYSFWRLFLTIWFIFPSANCSLLLYKSLAWNIWGFGIPKASFLLVWWRSLWKRFRCTESSLRFFLTSLSIPCGEPCVSLMFQCIFVLLVYTLFSVFGFACATQIRIDNKGSSSFLTSSSLEILD